MVKNTALISLIPIFIFLWEHIALTNDISIKPSIFIDSLTIFSQIMWKIIGICFAYLGSYYEYLHLDKAILTLCSLWISIKGLFNSISYFELGFDSVASLYDNPYMISICASLTLLLIIIILIKLKFRTLINYYQNIILFLTRNLWSWFITSTYHYL